MASNFNLGKNIAICTRILSRWHPSWSRLADQRIMIDNAAEINVELAIEVAFAAASGMVRVDRPTHDLEPAAGLMVPGSPEWHSCIVEKKTTTVNGTTFDINGMGGKLGALCVTAYCPRRDQLAFFHVPHDAIAGLPRRQDSPSVIRMKRTVAGDRWGELDAYRLPDFRAMADRARGAVDRAAAAAARRAAAWQALAA